MDTIQYPIDEETKWVIHYFEEHNIPYHIEYGIAIRDDLPEFIEMTYKRCGKTHHMPYDIYMDMLKMASPFKEMEFIAIASIYCNKCDMIPIKYLNTKIVIKKF